MKRENGLENIWGMKGCALPSGENCDACCTVIAIDDKNWGKKGFTKEIGVPCRFQASAKTTDQSGCLIYQLAPNSCENYHCSQSPVNVKLALINEAQKLELVTNAEAAYAVELAKAT